jgi:uncharacterized repeat protein (TIGR02543 family)
MLSNRISGKVRGIRVLVWSMAVLIALAFAPSGAFAATDKGVTFGERSNAANIAENPESVLSAEQAEISSLKVVTDKHAVAVKKVDGALLKVLAADASENPANKLIPIGNIVAGKKSYFNVVGLNHKAVLKGEPATNGTIAYVPYYLNWVAANITIEFCDEEGYYLYDTDNNFKMWVIQPKLAEVSFDVYYDIYTYNGNEWIQDLENLYQQTFYVAFNKGTLKYNANGGKTSKTTYVKKGSKYAFPKVSRSGFKLDGWYTKAVGGTKLSSKKTVPFSASKVSVTVFAHWTKPIKVKFNTKGGNLKVSDKEKYANSKKPHKVTHSKKYGKLPTPTKSGYKFRGWYPSTSTQAKKVTKNTYVAKSKTHTLVAQWLKKGKDRYITKAEYRLLKKGYTYADCKTIVGGSSETSDKNSDGDEVRIWLVDKNDHEKAAVGVLFENGVLVYKEWLTN